MCRQRFWVALFIATATVGTLANDASAGRRHHRGRSCAPVCAAQPVSNCGCNGSYGHISNTSMGGTWMNGSQNSNGTMGYSGMQPQSTNANGSYDAQYSNRSMGYRGIQQQSTNDTGYYDGSQSRGAVQVNGVVNANSHVPSTNVQDGINVTGNRTVDGNISSSVNGNVERNTPQNGTLQGSVNGSRNPTQSNADAFLNRSIQPRGDSGIPASNANISGQLNQSTDITPNR